jgi:hypothetical protein
VALDQEQHHQRRITKDLEWMKRAGIAGFQLADVNAGGGQTSTRKSSSAHPSGLTPFGMRRPKLIGSDSK